ncbi:hypothetical protein EC973_000338 [Apophysomyces ossiformis]|uniref:RING-type E3 ubiquitin transferase n=1 Tax=Apophysomyces ossiformis TaxID=679940 RepID=A0A8H7BQN3_9FUNG|nr:hypothetical protein EC973_000338 [Apophysomyces ossiformis]
MPDRIPPRVLLRQCVGRLHIFAKTAIRAILVATVWLVILPFTTLWTWRFYFWSGENIGFTTRGDKTLSREEDTAEQHSAIENTLDDSLSEIPVVIFGRSLRELATDCFEGQIITVAVVVVFIAAYLFREWVIQNTPAEAALELVAEDADEPDGPWGNHELGDEDRRRLAQQQVAVDTLLNAMNAVDVPDQDAQEEREHISERLEQIRRSLHRKQRAMDNQFPDNQDREIHTTQSSAQEMESSSIFGSQSEANEELPAFNLYSRNYVNAQYGNEIAPRGENSFSSSDTNDIPRNSPHQSILDDPNHEFWLQREQRYREYETSAVPPEPTVQADRGNKGKGRARGEASGSHSTVFGSEDLYDTDDNEDFKTQASSSYQELNSQRSTTERDDDENGSSSSEQRQIPRGSPWSNQNALSEVDHALDPSIQIPTRVPLARHGIPAMLQPQPIDHLQVQNEVRAEQGDNDNDNDNGNGNDNNNNEEAGLQGDEGFDIGDDIEGVLEAIGMRGNLWMLVQNSVLMALMISLCLAVAVWIPYVVGRVVILIRPISFVQTPIYILRLVTDPAVDFILDSFVPFAWSALASKQSIFPERIRVGVQSLVEHFAGDMANMPHDGVQFTGSIGSTGNTVTGVSYNVSSNAFKNTAAELYLQVQRNIEAAGALALDRWHQFALGSTGLDRTVCTIVGYLVMVFLGSWYIGRSSSGRRRANGNSFNEIIRQQGVFLKVFFFIVLELVVFPTICGILLDLATLPLFSDASIDSRITFLRESPYSGIFLHWFVGTGFMFHFAVFVTLCREVIRPGVMWFIRDPNDPQFHPVQEMIERPIFTLLRKISSSAVMYSGMIVIGIGSVTLAVSKYSGVYPLRWSFGAPLSTLAIDFLAAHFLLPPLISYIGPREFAKKALSTWWRAASAHLRLTSYMFNGRHPEEEGTHVRKTWKAWLFLEKAPISSSVYADVAIHDDNSPVIFRHDGQLVRAPKHDSVPVIPNRRMLVPVDPITLEAIDETERRNGHPAASETGDEEQSTVVVYIPPNFRLRVNIAEKLSIDESIVLTIYAGVHLSFPYVVMWIYLGLLHYSSTTVLLTPYHVSFSAVLLGRHMFETYLTPESQVHDIYAFSVGAYTMVLLGSLINWVSRKYTTISEVADWKAYLDETMASGKEKFSLASKAVYFSGSLGFIIPLLLGVAIDLYVFMPIRYSKSSGALVLHLSEDWAFGVVYLGIVYGVIYVLPTNPIQRALDQLTGNGIADMDIWEVTRLAIAPVIFGTVLAILFPGALALGTIRILGK